jgi:hypothetical protein
MQANLSRSFSLELHGSDIDVLKNLLELAITRLQNSPVQKLSGCPLSSQAGLKGTELIEVKEMIAKLAGELGMDKPALEPAEHTFARNKERANKIMDALLLEALTAGLPPSTWRL